MPVVEAWMNEQIQRFDKDLELYWDSNRERYRVRQHLPAGTETLMTLEGQGGEFVPPHPNLILYGDKELGIEGLVKRKKEVENKHWIQEWEAKEVARAEKQKREEGELWGDIANDMYDSMQTKSYIGNNPLAR